MNTLRDITVAIREWIPLIFYVTTLIVIPVIYIEWRNLLRRRACDKSVKAIHQDAN